MAAEARTQAARDEHAQHHANVAAFMSAAAQVFTAMKMATGVASRDDVIKALKTEYDVLWAQVHVASDKMLAAELRLKTLERAEETGA
ncbi:MAG TPA: hypothetical protein VHW01_04830 [Polyangiaceae bacterium]|nr:hypothetical protein [Polyangiaceae bacterium]